MFETTIQRVGHASHVVRELPDTKNGGTYLKCDCAGWAFAIKKGGCFHVKEAQRLKRLADQVAELTPSQTAVASSTAGIEFPAAAIATAARPVEVQPRRTVATPIDAMLALKVEAPRGRLSEDGYDEAGKKWPVFLRRDMAFEPKWDGYRLFVEARGGTVKLWGRSQHLANSDWPEIAAAFAWADGVFDGEVVALSTSGKHTFNALQNAGSMNAQQRDERVRYVLWDVLEANGDSVMRLTYQERRALLVAAAESRVGPWTPDARSRVILTPSQTDGVRMWNAIIDQGMEGVIAKPLQSGYHEGQRSEWLKLKPLGKTVMTVVAYTTGLSKDGIEYPFGAMVLAEEVDGRLKYAGKVGTGWTDAQIRELLDTLVPLERKTPAVDWTTTTMSKMRTNVAPRRVLWVEPVIRVTIEFQERGADGIPRFPSYKGIARIGAPA